MKIDDILKSNREKIFGYIPYINKSNKETTARLIKNIKFWGLVVDWKSLNENGVLFQNTIDKEDLGYWYLTSLNIYDTYIDQIKSIDNQLVVIQYMIFDVKCSVLSDDEKIKAVNYLGVLKEKCLYSHQLQQSNIVPTPEQKNFHSNKTDEELRAIFDNLIKGGYINKDTNIDDWLVLCTGKNLTRPMKAIQWMKTKVLLSIFINEAFKYDKKWNVAETYFVCNGKKSNNLSQSYTNATGNKNFDELERKIKNILS